MVDSVTDAAPSNLSQEAKGSLITNITAADRQVFLQWSQDPQSARNLNMPEQALRYVVITEGLMRSSEDPAGVKMRPSFIGDDETRLLVVQQKSAPISNEQSFNRYLAQKEAVEEQERANQVPGFLVVPKSKLPPYPKDVDPYHIAHQGLVKNGFFGLNDYFLEKVTLAVYKTNNQVLKVNDFRLRTELQKRRIGTNFYDRLDECAKALGFRFIVGQNWEHNIEFFRDKLGRATLDQVKPDAINKLTNITADPLSSTVRFLYPEDKALFLK